MKTSKNICKNDINIYDIIIVHYPINYISLTTRVSPFTSGADWAHEYFKIIPARRGDLVPDEIHRKALH